jgi:hypothetical protein
VGLVEVEEAPVFAGPVFPLALADGVGDPAEEVVGQLVAEEELAAVDTALCGVVVDERRG